jgi:hypothetical protein
MMRGSRTIVASVVIALAAVVVSAQLSSVEQRAIDAYQAAIRSAEAGGQARGIELAFTSFEALHDALMRSRNGESLLESLSAPEYERLQKLAGAIINREEIILVEPDPDYFVRLAAARGEKADRAFAAALKSTYPTSIWPVYIEPQTDYAGCTRLGSLDLVKTYRTWSDFQHEFPGRYTTRARKEAEAVAGALASSTCACGDLVSAEREFREFLRAFPRSTTAAAVERRLQSVKDRRSDIRPNCIAG